MTLWVGILAENYKKEGDFYIKQITKVPVKTLDFVIDYYFIGKFPEFLSLDAEGLDESIIKSIYYKIVIQLLFV